MFCEDSAKLPKEKTINHKKYYFTTLFCVITDFFCLHSQKLPQCGLLGI